MKEDIKKDIEAIVNQYFNEIGKDKPLFNDYGLKRIMIDKLESLYSRESTLSKIKTIIFKEEMRLSIRRSDKEPNTLDYFGGGM